MGRSIRKLEDHFSKGTSNGAKGAGIGAPKGRHFTSREDFKITESDWGAGGRDPDHLAE